VIVVSTPRLRAFGTKALDGIRLQPWTYV